MGERPDHPFRLDIPTIERTNLRDAVDYYRKLSYHRGLILEGVRLCAMRNRGIWNNAHRELFLSNRPITDEAIESILHAKQRQLRASEFRSTLAEYNKIQAASGRRVADDGGPFAMLYELTSTMETRLIAPIMWFPWEMYMCLLYVEIDAYVSHSRRIPDLQDHTIDSFLKENDSTIRALHAYRNKVLHPRANVTEEGAIDKIFSALEDSHQDELSLVFTIQKLIDCHIQCVALGILRSMDAELADLIEICKSTEKPHMRGKEKFGVWIERIRYIPPNTNLMSPQQFAGGTKTGVAPNLSTTAALPLVSRMIERRPWESQGISETQYPSRRTGFVRMLMRSLILISEGSGLTDAAKLLASEDPMKLPVSDIFKLMRDGAQPETLQECQYHLALERVALAMVTEPLRNYRAERRRKGENSIPSWIEDSLPTGDALERLYAYRNIVFHVGFGSYNPDEVERKWLEYQRDYPTSGIIHSLLEFYNPGL